MRKSSSNWSATNNFLSVAVGMFNVFKHRIGQREEEKPGPQTIGLARSIRLSRVHKSTTWSGYFQYRSGASAQYVEVTWNRSKTSERSLALYSAAISRPLTLGLTMESPRNETGEISTPGC